MYCPALSAPTPQSAPQIGLKTKKKVLIGNQKLLIDWSTCFRGGDNLFTLSGHRALLSVICLLHKMISCFLLLRQFVVGTVRTIWKRVVTRGRRDPSHNPLHSSSPLLLQSDDTVLPKIIQIHLPPLFILFCGTMRQCVGRFPIW